MHSKRHFFLPLLLLLFLCTCDRAHKESQVGSQESGENLPNLLIVLSDQHTYDMLRINGNHQVISPHLDQFATEGVRFTHAFSNQPVCTPYRGMIMSGRHPLKNGAFINDAPLLPNKTELLAQTLAKRGYQTGYIGKWHLLGGDRDRPIPRGELRYGFETLLTNNCKTDFRPGKSYYWNDEDEKVFFDQWEVDGQTEQALNYLDTLDKNRPFVLIVSWHPPHDWGKFMGEDGERHYRYDTAEDLMAMYDRDTLEMRPGLERTPDRLRMYHGHLASVTGVDRAFGRLMAKLDEEGLTDNTLTVFSADHGDMLESHGALIAKQYPHDYSVRIPLMMRWPGKLPAGQTTDLLIGSLDMLPTMFGLMGVETDVDYDGQNLAQAIVDNDEAAVDHQPLWVYKRGVARNNNWRGVVSHDWTFGMGRGRDSLEITNVLFDRQNDPDQLNNLFHDPRYADKKAELKAKTLAWMAKYNDEFWSEDDFLRIRPEETWEYNYEKSPYELFAEEKARESAGK